MFGLYSKSTQVIPNTLSHLIQYFFSFHSADLQELDGA
jgi:hypothetical protein